MAGIDAFYPSAGFARNLAGEESLPRVGRNMRPPPPRRLMSGARLRRVISVTRAERWGSRPGSPHTVTVLRTSPADREEGFPPFIITGFLLKEGDPDTAEFCVPRIVTSVVDAIDEINTGQLGAIRTLGFFEFELSFKGSTLANMAHLLIESLEAAASLLDTDRR